MNMANFSNGKIKKIKTKQDILNDLIQRFMPQVPQTQKFSPISPVIQRPSPYIDRAVPPKETEVTKVTEDVKVTETGTGKRTGTGTGKRTGTGTGKRTGPAKIAATGPETKESPLKRFISDPKTYEILTSIASIASAYEGEDKLAEVLSNISGRIGEGREAKRQTKEDALAAKLEGERDATLKGMEIGSQINKYRAAQTKGLIPLSNTDSGLIKEISNDPLAKMGLVQKINGELFIDTSKTEDYYNKREGSTQKLNTRISDTRNIVNKLDKLYATDLKTIGTFDAGVFNVSAHKVASILGFSQKEQDELSNMESLEADKFRTLFTMMRDPKTGATGFGALSLAELETVKNMLVNLGRQQSPEQYRNNLLTLKNYLEKGTLTAQKQYKKKYTNKNMDTYISSDERYKKEQQKKEPPVATDIKIQPNINTPPISSVIQRPSSYIDRAVPLGASLSSGFILEGFD